MDQHILRKIVAAVDSNATLAVLACSSRLLRTFVEEERGHCLQMRRQLGLAAAAEASGRAAAVLDGNFRRQFLADLAEAHRRRCCYDGRRQTWDFLSLPGGGQWLGQVQLLATDLQHVLLYDRAMQLLGALSFVDRPAGSAAALAAAAAGSGEHKPAGLQPRMFFGLLSTLLFKCPLHAGLLFLDPPPLLLGAGDCLLHPRRQQEELATAGDSLSLSWRQQLGVDDDVHLLRVSLLRLHLLQHIAVLGGSLAGTLDDALVRQVAAQEEMLALRFLDLTGSQSLTDASLAQLLALAPQLRVLHAGCTSLGPAALEVLAGRRQQQVQQQQEAEPSGPRARQHHPHPGSGAAGDAAFSASAGGATVPAAGAVTAELGSLHLGSTSTSSSGRTRNSTGAESSIAGTVLKGSPSCPLLEHLDLSGCRAVKGSALRRAVCCLPHLQALRLNGCGGSLHALLEALLPLTPAAEQTGRHGQHGSSKHNSKSSGSGSSKAMALQAVLAQLTRLEALDADGLTGRHVGALLAHCTRLRALALSSKQLAADGLDHAEWQRQAGISSSSSSSSNQNESSCSAGGSSSSNCEQSTLPSLLQLEIGWGTGGTCLLHMLDRHAPNLASLTAHVGAEVSDWHLQALAASRCAPILARLCLKGSNVTDAGVAAVLQHCMQLTSLQLLSCTGPFTDSLAAPAGGGGGCWQRAPAFRLQELHISWGAAELSDAGLGALLHPGFAALRCLVLKGCSRLTDAAWAAMAQHASTLRCLHLESCGAAAALQKARAAAGQQSMTASAAVKALAACQELQALTVGGCWVAPCAADVRQLCAACTGLLSVRVM